MYDLEEGDLFSRLEKGLSDTPWEIARLRTL